LSKKAYYRVILFISLIFFTHLIVVPAPGHASDKFLIKFATVAPEGTVWMNFMSDLDKTIRKKTNGEIGFKFYPGGILGDELDVLRKIWTKQVHSAAFSGEGISQILPMVRVLDLPFLFRNDQETDRVQEALYDYFSKYFQEKGFEFLSWAEVGNVHLFSKKPIHRIKDLVGLKIWTGSGDPISKETFSVMGTNPIPLPVTSVTTALNTGMIDTVYAPPLGALALQWNIYTKYMTSLPLAHASGVVLISKKYFDGIPPRLSVVLKAEFKRSMSDLTSELRKKTEDSISLMKASGMEIIPKPSGADLKAFYNVHDRVAQNLAGKIYPRELLNRVYEILKRNPH
jgi:TRAP-type C4-dicarboxylate transport system substrate-binding protein